MQLGRRIGVEFFSQQPSTDDFNVGIAFIRIIGTDAEYFRQSHETQSPQN